MGIEQLYKEKELLASISVGNEAAFRLLYNLYRSRLYGVALKMIRSAQEAEEIVQEVFLSIWTYKDRLPSVEDPSAYIFSIAYHKIYGRLKAIARDTVLVEEIISHTYVYTDNTMDILDFHESKGLVSKAVKRLPPQRQLIYRLSREDGLNYDEIAELLHISRNTARNQLVEALKFIRMYLQQSATLLLLLLEMRKK